MSTVEPYADPRIATDVPASLDPLTDFGSSSADARAAFGCGAAGSFAECWCCVDLIGLRLPSSSACVSSTRRGGGHGIRPQVELLIFGISLPAWVVVRRALRALRLRRGAHRPLDGRRPRRRAQPRDGGQLALPRVHGGHARSHPGRASARLLGPRDRVDPGARDRARGRSAEARLRSEHDHRGRGRRRAARGRSFASTPSTGSTWSGSSTTNRRRASTA